MELRAALRDERQLLRHTFGPSTPGAINLVSGNNGAVAGTAVRQRRRPDGDADRDAGPSRRRRRRLPTTAPTAPVDQTPLGVMTGKNIGDLLNAQGVTWGWFQGGFAPTSTNRRHRGLRPQHRNIGGATVTDYIPHHEPFQYYAITANPNHLPPSSVGQRSATATRPTTSTTCPTSTARWSRQPAGGQLPQGAGLPGRSRRLLRSARRTDLRRQHDQPLEQSAVLERAPRSSSPTTTPTAGTTTSSRRS